MFSLLRSPAPPVPALLRPAPEPAAPATTAPGPTTAGIGGPVEPADPLPAVQPLYLRPVLVLAAASVALVAIGSLRFTYFGDELYFLSAGYRLSWGYADQPALLPVLARLMDTLAPGSPLLLRVPAYLAAGGTVVVAAALAAQLGGRRRAQIVTAAVAAICPQALSIAQQLATASIDPLLWATMLLLVVRWTRQDREGRARDRGLLLLGLVLALALATKLLVLGLVAGLVAGVLLAGPRRLLTRPALWVGGLLALASTIPYLLWQARNGWPQLEMGAVTESESVMFGGREQFVMLALLLAGLLPGIPLLLRGWWNLLRSPRMRTWRWAGIAVGVTAVAMVAAGGRPYYLAGLYPLLFAAGAVASQHAADEGRAGWWGWVTDRAVFASMAVLTVLTVLPAPGYWTSSDTRTGDGAGWELLADDVATRVAALPPAQRQSLVIVTSYYWQASALDYYGPARGLPPVYSGSRGFGYFGPPPDSANLALLVGDVPGTAELCREIRPLAPHVDPLAQRFVNRRLPLALCTPRVPWSQAWPALQTMIWPLTEATLRAGLSEPQ